MSPTIATFVSHLSAAMARCVQPFAALATAWERRRIVGQLGTLDDRMLRDIGITRHDVLSVLAEPLYRDPSEQLALRAADARRSRRAMARAMHAHAADVDLPPGRRAA